MPPVAKLFLGVLAIVALVPAAIAGLYLLVVLRDVLRIAWFWLTSRRLDPNPPEDDVTARPLDKKLTPDEEAYHRAALWAQLYRLGLSRAKLNALRSLREQQRVFTASVWVERVEWRAWCRLGREATGALQTEALARAKSMGAVRYEQFAPPDLALYLALYDESEARTIEQRWAEKQLARGAYVRPARQRLEAFAERADSTGGASVRVLFSYFLGRNELGRAIVLVARFKKVHEAVVAELLPRLQQRMAPEISLGSFGGRRVAFCSRAERASFHLTPLRFEASPEAASDWLRSPPGLGAAKPQPEALQRALKLRRMPFLSRAFGVFSLPPLRGPFLLTIEAKPAPDP
jgi:hypothetical protein